MEQFPALNIVTARDTENRIIQNAPVMLKLIPNFVMKVPAVIINGEIGPRAQKRAEMEQFPALNIVIALVLTEVPIIQNVPAILKQNPTIVI